MLKFGRKTFKEQINQIYFNSIEDIQKSDEYKKSVMQINCIRNILVDHADIPAEVLDNLIETVEEKVTLEYEFANNCIFKYVNKKFH